MQLQSFSARLFIIRGLQLLCFCFLFPGFPPFSRGAVAPPPPSTAEADSAALHSSPRSNDPAAGLPDSLGTIIYRFNGQSPSQLYIVGISHRDPLHLGNCATTIATQSELYRIGEWLKLSKNLDLLLPEGYFGSPKSASAIKMPIATDLRQKYLISLDDDALKKELSVRSRYVNAEMLLMENLHMQACQVENGDLYEEVLSGLIRVIGSPSDSLEYLQASSDLHRVQRQRTFFILQKAPEVIDDSFKQGRIRKRKALLTIGLNHLRDIIGYIKNDDLENDPLLSGQQGEASPLNLIRDGFGVTVIVPHTMALNQSVLKSTGLDGYL